MTGPLSVRGAGGRRSPEEILKFSPEEADELLERLESEVPFASGGLAQLPGEPNEEATVFGDTHGDWRSTVAASARFLEEPGHRCLVGLGDYVDRAPEDCGEGSVANSLYLLQLVAQFPDRVFLIQGNHETTRRFPVLPQNLAEEVDALWGPDIARYSRLLALLERGPIAALTSKGVYLAHGGFPRGGGSRNVRDAFRAPTEDELMDIVWGECGASNRHRGITTPFDSLDLTRFLSAIGARVFLRGHDPDMVGKSVYQDRCLTLHTSRVYERFGGVLVARVPLDRPVHTTKDIAVEHLPTEGRSFPEPW